MQRQSRISKKLEETKQSKRDIFDIFSIVSWILSGLVFVVLLIVKFTPLTLDAIEFSLLGASIALIIISFASKLKFLGIEFERLQVEKTK